MSAILIPGPTNDAARVRVHLTDGNETLDAVERVKQQLTDNPHDFPALTAAHLMGAPSVGATNTQVATNIDLVIPRDYRARIVGGALFKYLRDANPILLYDVYLLQRRGFVKLLQETARPDSLASGLTEAELERSWEIFEQNMRLLASKGATLRKRKDSGLARRR